MKPDAHIFPSQRNEHLSVAAIEEIYEKYTQKAKAEHPDLFCRGPYTPHVMRHTTATHLIEAGVPLAIVKNILGIAEKIYLDFFKTDPCLFPEAPDEALPSLLFTFHKANRAPPGC